MTETTIMRILREINGYSQEYVGSILGIEQNTYSKLESGQTKLSLDRVKKLAELYKVEPDIFLSKETSTIHLNKGKGSHSNSGIIENYYDNVHSRQYYDKLVQEKERLIITLQQEIKELRKEKDQLLKLVKKLSK